MRRRDQRGKPARNPLPSRIWTFGALAPTVNAEAAEDQFRRAQAYKNKLIEIERWRRERYREIIATGPDVDAPAARVRDLEQELAALRATIQHARKSARRRVEATATSVAIKTVLGALREARGALKTVRTAAKADPVIKAQVTALDTEAGARLRAARAECGVYWGTYLLVEQAAERQRKEQMDPRFRRWDGGGRVGVQIQSTKPLRDLTSDTRLQIDPVPEEAWSANRHRRRLLSRTKARLRIGTADDGAPVWAEFPIVLHRRLPPDADICWAWVSRKRIGLRYRWELQLTIKSSTFLPAVDEQREGVIAVNLGWRTFGEDGLRVAYWADDAGRTGEVLMPASIPDKLRHADSIGAIRDRSFNEGRAKLLAWLATGPALPDALREALANLAQWRSCARLAAVVWRWREARFAGDETIFPVMDAWRAQDRHLYRWTSDETVRTLGRRREFFRLEAIRLLGRYRTILVDDTDMRQMARRALPEGEPDAPPAARRNRFAAAPGEFREAIKLAAAKRGVEIVATSPTTKPCHACGVIDVWDSLVEVDHVCSGCGLRWDQDLNACRNMLGQHRASGPMVDGSGEALAGVGPSGDSDLGAAGAEHL